MLVTTSSQHGWRLNPARLLKPENASLRIYAIGLTGFVLSLLSFWPGFMEYDSFDQYGQAIGQYPLDDGHPVIMALLWKVLISIHDGPQLMLLLQLVLYWGGFIYLAVNSLARTEHRGLAISAVVVPFLPFLLNFSGVIWKDTHFALALFWPSLLLLFAKRSNAMFLGSVLLIYYGIAVRYNGLAAALPVLLLWSYEFSSFLNFNYQRAVPVLAVCLGLALFLLSICISNVIVGAEKTGLLNDQLLNEIAFIGCQTKTDIGMIAYYYDTTILKVAEQNRPSFLCNQIYSLAMIGDTGDIYEREVLKHPGYDDEGIKSLWISNVTSHPLLYLKYRLLVYRTFLRPLSYAEAYYPFCDGTDKNPFPDRFSAELLNPLGLTTLLEKYVRLASQRLSIFFRPFFWLITLVLTCGLSFLKKNVQAELISASGICYILGYLPFLPAPDFRYAYWAIFAQILSGFLLLLRPATTVREDPVTSVP